MSVKRNRNMTEDDPANFWAAKKGAPARSRDLIVIIFRHYDRSDDKNLLELYPPSRCGAYPVLTFFFQYDYLP